MLNPLKLLHEIHTIDTVVPTIQPVLAQSLGCYWRALAAHPHVIQMIHSLGAPGVPLWYKPLDQVEPIMRYEPDYTHYTVYAVDGSQVYPDRHQGTDAYLINIGTAVFNYSQQSSVQFNSKPLCTWEHDAGWPDAVTSAFIDGLRGYEEFLQGMRLGQALAPESCLLLDGTLIFWHLGEYEHYFLERYLATLADYYAQRRLHVAYTSLPKSRDLIAIVRALCRLPNYSALLGISAVPLDGEHLVSLTDADLVSTFLQPGQRTIVFESRSTLTAHYPAPLKPCFFYMDTGKEIARVEIPRWIAQKPSLVEHISKIIYDQCCKGRGYPICLAYAHEQAVIKAADREFFYRCLYALAQKKGQACALSRKSFNKRY